MQLDYRMPDARLRSLLTVHALLSGVDQPQIETVPAMLPNLHIRLSGTSAYRFDAGEMVKAPRVSVIGPTSAAYQVSLAPDTVLLTTGFLPEGWIAFTRLSAGEMRDTVTDGADLWGATVVETLCDQLSAARSQTARLGLMESFLMARMRPRDASHLAATAAINHWIETTTSPQIDALAEHLDIGHRHLRRLTFETHGASPKTLAMKYRCLRVAAALSARGPAGVDETLPMFADQAHLIRDFRRFVGWTPMALVDRAHSVAASTLRGRRVAGATRPLILLS